MHHAPPPHHPVPVDRVESLGGTLMYEESATHEIAPAAAEANGPSRRQLVKAGIWAAPVVVLATASPAAAVSISAVTLTRGTQGVGTDARTWSFTLAVAGTANAKSWSIQAITSGGPVTISGVDSATSTATTFNGVATLTNWSSTNTFFFRFTSGSQVIDSGAITVTSPVQPVVTPGPVNAPTSGSGGKTVTVSVSATASVSSLTARLTLLTAPNNPGTWSNGNAWNIAQTVTDNTAPFAFAFPAFNKQTGQDTYTYKIDFWDTAIPSQILSTVNGSF